MRSGLHSTSTALPVAVRVTGAQTPEMVTLDAPSALLEHGHVAHVTRRARERSRVGRGEVLRRL